MSKRLFIISNRLPVTIEEKDNGYIYRQSSGGLISAVSAYLNVEGKGAFAETIWAGVPDCSEKVWENTSDKREGLSYTYLPVFMTRKQYEPYYNGFSNSLIWPLFHYFPSFADYSTDHLAAYKAANVLFADTLASQLRPGDVVWIHDYHLLLLAGIIRERFPAVSICFFLHIPFPSYELFRVIPKQWQRELLNGLLGADLIGFHTLDYATHFLNCVEMVLKAEHNNQLVWWENRQVKADAFPIGIDYQLFHNAYDDEKVIALRNQYLELKGDKQLIFSVDRLDYTKGVSNRLKGYEEFLRENPEYKGRVVFAMVVVPSRDMISKYAERKKMIDEYIGNLNSRIGNISWQPVMYQYSHLPFEELEALYTACDLALITPLRDGMNLVAKEFVASRKDKRGALILSEMAGAARELTDALLINPNDTSEIAAMIKYALEMPADEQAARITAMQERVRLYDVHAWAKDIFAQMKQVKEAQLEFEILFLDNTTKAELLQAYAVAEKRLLLLDYDGTLVPFSTHPSMARPGPELLETLQRLSDNPLNDIYIISGRDGRTLEEWLGHLPIGLVAEHGAKIRMTNGKWEERVTVDVGDWMRKTEQIMQNYVSKCPNTFIEKKEFSLAWHYRNAGIKQSTIRAKELCEELLNSTAHLPLQVLQGNKVLEVRNKGVNKGIAAESILSSGQYDFILALGDDTTDEDMFKKLARMPQAFTIKIGNAASFAKFNLHNPGMTQSLLHTIAFYELEQNMN